jgi:inorganic pyrophosphatase
MSLLEVELGPNPPEIVNVVVEIPKGSTNKYEVDARTGVLRLDRVLYSPLFYPFDYGYIPQTLYVDGDPLDALVVMSHPTFPGCVVEARPIAVLAMRDEKGADEKVLCVAYRDPRFNSWSSLRDLNEHTQKEIIHFFEVYKALEEKSVEVLGWHDAPVALTLIEKYARCRG